MEWRSEEQEALVEFSRLADPGQSDFFEELRRAVYSLPEEDQRFDEED